MSTNEERFGEIVKARREELDFSQIELWHSGGPSNTTLTKIESGRPGDMQRKTFRLLDKSLRWEPGSARETFLGGNPTPLPADAAEIEDEIDLTALSPESREAILKIIRADKKAKIDKSRKGELA